MCFFLHQCNYQGWDLLSFETCLEFLFGPFLYFFHDYNLFRDKK